MHIVAVERNCHGGQHGIAAAGSAPRRSIPSESCIRFGSLEGGIRSDDTVVGGAESALILLFTGLFIDYLCLVRYKVVGSGCD